MSLIDLGKIGDKPFKLPADSLTTHTVITGMTGSGKTGVLVGLTEELGRIGVPTLMVDVKGDLANIALQKDPELKNKLAIRYITPGATHGESVNLLSGLGDPERITPTVTALLKLIGRNADPIRSVEHAYLSSILQQRHDAGESCGLVDLVKSIIEPGFETLGAMDLNQVMPLKARISLASDLNTVLVAPSFDPWKTGIPLDIGSLLAPRADGRIPVVIYSVSHIVEDEERIFALSLLLDAVVSWTRKLTGTQNLRASVLIDECYGLIPPYPANPPTKRPILTLLKQARAFGVGLILATQNPVDLDYKALSNCGTWFVGRLQTGKDRDRVSEGVCGAGMYDRKQLDNLIGQLKSREFILAKNNKVFKYRSRDVTSELYGPMSPTEIKALYQAKDLIPVDNIAVIKQKLDEAKAMYTYSTGNDALKSKIVQLETLLVELSHA